MSHFREGDERIQSGLLRRTQGNKVFVLLEDCGQVVLTRIGEHNFNIHAPVERITENGQPQSTIRGTVQAIRIPEHEEDCRIIGVAWPHERQLSWHTTEEIRHPKR